MRDSRLTLNPDMITYVFATTVMLCMRSFGTAFIGSSSSVRAPHTEVVVGRSMSMSSSDARSRRDFMKEFAITAGIFGSTLVPAATGAATSSKPEGEIMIS